MSHINIAYITTRIKGALNINIVLFKYNTACCLTRGNTITERNAINVLILN
jgi:hypothetical protein